MTTERLNATQWRILESLATYRLLNVRQMLRLKVAGSEETVRLEARVLERKRLIFQSEHRLVVGVTTLPRLHWLSDRGAEILATGSPDDPHGADRDMGDARQIMHRMKIVETHIALREWAAAAGCQVNWFVTDFEPGSGGLRKPTTIEYTGEHGPRFTPDALADVIGPDGHSRLLAFEIERGRAAGKRLTEFKKKFCQLREVSAGRVVERWAGRPKHQARFLVIFANSELRNKALTCWPEPENPAWLNFFVKCDDDLADFNAGWWRPGGRSQQPLFPFGPAAPAADNAPPPAA